MKDNKEEFVKLISTHRGIIHKVCNVYLDTAEDRRDLFQDIVFQLWKSYPNFRGDSKVSTWLYRVALNTAISSIRKKEPLFIGGIHDKADESSGAGLSENRQLLRTLINSLNKVEKSLILLHLEEKSYEEIAEITGMSKSNVSVRLVRIRKKLAKLYKTETI